MHEQPAPPGPSEAGRASLSQEEIFAIERPKSSLLVYYVLSSLLLGPFFFLILTPLYFRYQTMRYRFDDEGVSMRWGILFRREVHLRYARIQDIHLVSNVIERWFGLARIKIQTASGSSQAEMTIEGIEEFQELRDFLYTRMRGTHAGPKGSGASSEAGAVRLDARAVVELTETLREVGAELRALRQNLEVGPRAGGHGDQRDQGGSGA